MLFIKTGKINTILLKINLYIRTLGSVFFRSSRSQMFFKIAVLKNFAIFTGKIAVLGAGTGPQLY